MVGRYRARKLFPRRIADGNQALYSRAVFDDRWRDVPFDPEIIEDLAAELPRHLRQAVAAIIDDRRFTELIYRVALAGGIMERIKYQDPPDDIG